MKIRVRFFGYVAERAGCAEIEVEAEPVVGSVVAAVQREIPALERLDPSVRFAVNTNYALSDSSLMVGDVVSFIPPVGGG